MQFSIKQLLVVTTVVSFALAILFGLPSVISLVLMTLGLLWLPIFLFCGLVYARDWKRTFYIGATFAAAPFLLLTMVYLPIYMVMILSAFDDFDLSELQVAVSGSEVDAFAVYKYLVAGFYAYIGLSGLVALASRWIASPALPVAKPAPAPAAIESASALQRSIVQGRLTTEVLQPVE